MHKVYGDAYFQGELGYNNDVDYPYSEKYGYKSVVRGDRCVAVGNRAGTYTAYDNWVAIGYSAETGSSGVAIGVYADATGNGVSIGGSAIADNQAVNIGATRAYGSAVAIGKSAVAAASSVCIGIIGDAEQYAVGVGYTTQALGNSSVSIGREAYTGPGGASTSATGEIYPITGNLLIDGSDKFTISDTVFATPTVFEFDSDSSVVETTYLRAVPFTALDTNFDVRDALVIAINLAPALYITATGTTSGSDPLVTLVNTHGGRVGEAGDAPIINDVSDVGFITTGMDGGDIPGEGSIAIGSFSETLASGAIAIGRGVSNVSFRGTSVGHGSQILSSAEGSIAIGRSSSIQVGSQNSMAVGDGAVIYDGSIASIALGCQASIGTTSSANSDYSTAIGYKAWVADTVDHGMAIGSSASCSHGDAIVFGREAVSTAVGRCTVGTIGGSYDMELQFGKGFAAFGVTPPSTQPTKISDTTETAGASYTSNEQDMLNSLKVGVNAIVDVLEGAGLVASV